MTIHPFHASLHRNLTCKLSYNILLCAYDLFFSASCLPHRLPGIGQYKNDNVLYRLVYFQDLCKTMEENPGYLLLDVRSKGEYEDTSSSS